MAICEARPPWPHRIATFLLPSRPVFVTADYKMLALLDPRRVLKRIYMARVALAAAIFLAAIFVWQRAAATDTLIVALAFAATLSFTVGSVAWTNVYHRAPGVNFLYGQALFDLVLVTAVVHVTGGGASQFAALYILVIASAALLLPVGGGLLVALAGCTLYFGDVILARDAALDAGVLLQMVVFGVVAVSSGYVSARLKEAGAGSAELAAELSAVRLQANDILRNIRSGVVTVDADGLLLFANPAAASLLGIDLERRLGSRVLPEMAAVAPEIAQALSRTARGGARVTRGEGSVSVGGRTFPVGVTTTASETGGASRLAATAIFSDISDQKRLETLHLRAERLEAVAELSASLAHEIKNPLAAIRSAVEQLARMPGQRPPDAPDDDRASDAAMLSGLIVRESDRLSRLLSEFLDFARVRMTRLEPVDLGAIAADAVRLAEAHPDRHPGVRVECVVNAPGGALLLEGDHDLLHRAVFNLALNAVQAAPENGYVRVEVVPLAVDQTPSGLVFDHGAVALRVTDDGAGIPAEVRDSLFEPFITTKPGGSGLGLAIVHRAIEAHKGVVFVDSVPTGGALTGTRFTVLLPRAQGDRPD